MGVRIYHRFLMYLEPEEPMRAGAVRAAFEALGARDVGPLAALMHPDIEWRGQRTWRFWKPVPS
jgi:ketosteroid isomerase-like protein